MLTKPPDKVNVNNTGQVKKISGGKTMFRFIIAGIVAIILGNVTTVMEITWFGLVLFGIAILTGMFYIMGVKGQLSSKEKIVGWLTLDETFTEAGALVISGTPVELKASEKADFSDDDILKTIISEVNLRVDEQRKPRNDARVKFLAQLNEEFDKRTKEDIDKKDKKPELEKAEKDEKLPAAEEVAMECEIVEEEKTKKKPGKKSTEVEELKKLIDKVKEGMEQAKSKSYLTLDMFKEIKTNCTSGYFYYCDMWKPWMWGNGSGYFDSFIIYMDKPWKEKFHEDEIEDDHIVGVNLTIRAYVADLSVLGLAQPDVPVFNVEYTVNDSLHRAAKVKDYVKEREKFVEALKRYCSSLRAQNERTDTEMAIYADDAEYWEAMQKKTHQRLKMSQSRGAMEQNADETDNSKYIYVIGFLVIVIFVMSGILSSFFSAG
jgi:hypothetical protein